MKEDEHFTLDKLENAIEAFDELTKALPKKKIGEMLGHINEISLFLEAAKRVLS